MPRKIKGFPGYLLRHMRAINGVGRPPIGKDWTADTVATRHYNPAEKEST